MSFRVDHRGLCSEGSAKSTRLCLLPIGITRLRLRAVSRLLGCATVEPLGSFRMPPCALLQIDNRLALSQSVEGEDFASLGLFALDSSCSHRLFLFCRAAVPDRVRVVVYLVYGQFA